MYKKYLIAFVVLLVAGVAYYGVSPIFMHTRIDERAPDSIPTLTSVSDEPSPVIGTFSHPASGSARIISTSRGDILRYENFKTINGPDLYIYLAKDLDAKEYVNLGLLKATEGNVNYEIPHGTNIHEYRYALVWCKLFGVLFNYAELTPSEQP